MHHLEERKIPVVQGLAVAKSKIDSFGTDITVTLKIVERSSTRLGKGKEGK